MRLTFGVVLWTLALATCGCGSSSKPAPPPKVVQFQLNSKLLGPAALRDARHARRRR